MIVDYHYCEYDHFATIKCSMLSKIIVYHNNYFRILLAPLFISFKGRAE